MRYPQTTNAATIFSSAVIILSIQEKEVYTSISANGGVMFKLVNELALKVGVGYGMRNVAYEMVDGKYVKNTEVSTAGVEALVGAHYKIGKLVLSLDMVTTSFKVFEAKLGIGMGY